jgi:hypothetical protein
MDKSIMANAEIKQEVETLIKKLSEVIIGIQTEKLKSPVRLDCFNITIKYITYGAAGSIYEIINDKGYDYIAKIQKCNTNEYKIERHLFSLTESLTLKGVPNIPLSYKFYDGGDWCIIFMQKAQTNLDDFLNQVDNQSILRSITEQMVISLYIFHKYFGFYHCDTNARNFMIYNIPTDPPCWEYIFDFGTYRVKNFGYKVSLIDFGGSLPIDQKVLENMGIKFKDDPELNTKFLDRKYKGCNVTTDYENMLIDSNDAFELFDVLESLNSNDSKTIAKGLLDFLNTKTGKDEIVGNCQQFNLI